MALNLSRNTKLYVSTVQTGFTNLNTYEVPVLDGYSFSQDVETQTISLTEAGCTPSRGQKIFNTALNVVELSFPTYMKPYDDGTGTNCIEQILWEAFVGNGPTVGTNAVPSTGYVNPMRIDFAQSDTHELLKINLIFVLDTTAYMVTDVGINAVDIDFAIDAIATLSWTGQGATITELAEALTWVAGTDYKAEGTGTEAPQFIKNKLSQVELYADTKTAFNGFQAVNYGGKLATTSDVTGLTAGAYDFNIAVDGGTEETVTVTTAGTEVALSEILTLINVELAATTDTNKAVATIDDNGNIQIQSSDTGAAGYAATSVIMDEGNLVNVITAPFFTYLATTFVSTVSFQSIAAAQVGLAAGKQYLIPITGGSLTLTNNVTYLTPEELGKVNRPIAGGFTGTREFGGSLTAYLNTGDNRSGGLLTDLTDTSALNDATNRFYMNISVGGCNSAPRVDLEMSQAQLTVPTFSVEDVISTEIGFTAIGTDLNLRDELIINYYADDIV